MSVGWCQIWHLAIVVEFNCVLEPQIKRFTLSDFRSFDCRWHQFENNITCCFTSSYFFLSVSSSSSSDFSLSFHLCVFCFTCCATQPFSDVKICLAKDCQQPKEHSHLFVLAQNQHVWLRFVCALKQKCNIYHQKMALLLLFPFSAYVFLEMRSLCLRSISERIGMSKANRNSFWLTRQFHKREMLYK